MLWPGGILELGPATRLRCGVSATTITRVSTGLICCATANAAACPQIYNAEDIDNDRIAVKTTEADFGAKCPKAVAKITDDLDLRMTNPIESTSAAIQLRLKVAKGRGSTRADSLSDPPTSW